MTTLIGAAESKLFS